MSQRIHYFTLSSNIFFKKQLLYITVLLVPIILAIIAIIFIFFGHYCISSTEMTCKMQSISIY